MCDQSGWIRHIFSIAHLNGIIQHKRTDMARCLRARIASCDIPADDASSVFLIQSRIQGIFLGTEIFTTPAQTCQSSPLSTRPKSQAVHQLCADAGALGKRFDSAAFMPMCFHRSANRLSMRQSLSRNRLAVSSVLEVLSFLCHDSSRSPSCFGCLQDNHYYTRETS